MGQTVTIKVSNQNFDGAPGYTTSNQPGTPIVFTSLNVSANVTFSSSTPMIVTAVTGACEISTAHTYDVGLYAFGTQLQLVSNVVPSGNTLKFTLTLPISTFPSTATGDVVITQN